VEISQHIKDLLFVHDRVILNGFGAFVAKYSPASVDKSTNTISPPSKEIIFDNESKNSGGLLEKHMAERENIAQDDASKQIEEFVKTVISKLKAGKKVKFPELGTFALDKDGKTVFLYEPTGNLLLDSYGLSKISLPESVAPAEIDKAESGEKKSKRRWMIPVAIILLLALFLGGVYFLKRDWWDNGKLYVTQIFIKNSDKPADKDNSLIPDETDTTDNGVADTELTSDDTAKRDKTDKSDKTDKNNKSDKNDKSDKTDKNNVPVSNDTVKPDDKAPLTNDDSSSDGTYKLPEKGKSYVIVGSVASSKAAEAEKGRFAKRGITVDIIPSGAGRYRLSAGTFNSPSDAVVFYNNFNAEHKGINVWLWENK